MATSYALIRRSIELDPSQAAWHNDLGYVLIEFGYAKSGHGHEAAAALRRCLSLQPNSVSAHANYAATFETHLAALDYRAPQLVASAMRRRLGEPCASLDVLDAGCGTGLCAEGLRPFARRFVGVDLSQ